jgi:hypothetical protein
MVSTEAKRLGVGQTQRTQGFFSVPEHNFSVVPYLRICTYGVGVQEERAQKKLRDERERELLEAERESADRLARKTQVDEVPDSPLGIFLLLHE